MAFQMQEIVGLNDCVGLAVNANPIPFERHQANLEAGEINRADRLPGSKRLRKNDKSLAAEMANTEMPVPVADCNVQIVGISGRDRHATHPNRLQCLKVHAATEVRIADVVAAIVQPHLEAISAADTIRSERRRVTDAL